MFIVVRVKLLMARCKMLCEDYCLLPCDAVYIHVSEGIPAVTSTRLHGVIPETTLFFIPAAERASDLL